MITKKSYENIVELHSDNLYAYMVKHLRDRALAKDFTQDAFLKLWEKRLFLKKEVAKSWLFKTAYNRMLNYIRDNKRMSYEEELKETYFSSDTYDHLETTDFLDYVFNQLSMEEKTIILLRDQEGYSYKEIAEIINVNEGVVKNRLFQARKKFSLRAEKEKTL